jgi:hypothetical protein
VCYMFVVDLNFTVLVLGMNLHMENCDFLPFYSFRIFYNVIKFLFYKIYRILLICDCSMSLMYQLK